jgi:redox-sensitive bicupin YhaK (pirin superfamily)
MPDRTGIAPSYKQKHFADSEKRGRLRVIAARDGRDGAVTIHQDAVVYAGLFDGAESATLDLAPGRRAYVHVARGRVRANGTDLAAGDALKLSDVAAVTLERGQDAEVLVFDLP